MGIAVRTAVTALALTFGLSACGLDGGGGDDSSAAHGAGSISDEKVAEGAADAGGGGADFAPQAPAAGSATGRSAAGGGALTRGRPAAVDRAIAYVGELRVEVDDVTAASSSAITQVAGAGGTLFAQETALGESATASLTFKVPPSQFTRLLAALGKLGEPLGQTVTSEDVTEQLVDLEARLRTAKASADRVRALLSRAGTIAEIVNLEREVAAREAEVESMQARLRSLEGRIEEATLTVLLTADRDDLVTDDDERGFLAGLRSGWDAFTASAAVVATVAGAVLPFAGLAAALAAGALVVRRRRAQRMPAVEATPTALG